MLRQPYAAFAKALLERQNYPDLREYPGGPPKRPYDVTAHTLPLLLGVRVTLSQESLAVGLSAPAAAPRPAYRVAGLSQSAGQRPQVRVAIYKSYAASMDEGWTRWVFDQYGVPYQSLEDSIVRAGALGARYDVIILPEQTARGIIQGLPARRYPARYAGGLGAAGVQELREFVDSGGTLIAFNDACDFVIDALELPVTNVLSGTSPREFYAPGSILRIRLDTASALAQGLAADGIAWFESSPAFDVQDPTRVRVVARYPAAAPELLLSGWLLGAQHLVGRAALVEVRRGRGRAILFGFRPQYRGQTQATYPLIWNALRTAARETR